MSPRGRLLDPSAAREKEPLELLRKPRVRGDEVSGPRRDQAFAGQCCGEGIADSLKGGHVIPGGDERRDSGFADPIQIGPRLAGHPTAVSATNPVGHRFRERPVVDPGCAGQAQELPECLGVSVEAVGQNGVADALEMLDVSVARHEVVQRRFDHGQGPNVFRPLRRRDEGSQNAVRVSDDMRTGGEQGEDVGGVDVEVLAPLDRRAGRIAAAMDVRKGPAWKEWRESGPGCVGTRTAVDQQDLGTAPLACDGDRGHPGKVSLLRGVFGRRGWVTEA